MYRRLVATNFACFRELDVELKPLTVAIGQNNTGKSTFLEAVWLACHDPGGEAVVRWGFRGSPEDSRAALSPSSPAPRRASWRLTLPSSGPHLVSEGLSDDEGPPRLTADGQGVAALLDWMLRRDRQRFFGFVDAVRAAVPGVVDLEIGSPTKDTRSVVLVGEDGLKHNPTGGSAGVRLLLVFLALAWHPEPPELVLVEEPENGFHPERLREVMDLLRGLVTGQHAPRPVQVVLTTHSPYVLSCVEVPRDQVLVFRRQDDGSCTASPVDLERVRPYLPDFALGEIWSNLGDAGLVSAA